MTVKSIAEQYWWWLDENRALHLNKYPKKKRVIFKHQGTPESAQVFIDGIEIPRREKPNP